MILGKERKSKGLSERLGQGSLARAWSTGDDHDSARDYPFHSAHRAGGQDGVKNCFTQYYRGLLDAIDSGLGSRYKYLLGASRPKAISPAGEVTMGKLSCCCAR